MVDMWGALRGLSDAFQVRVQLFTHTEHRSRWGALLETRPEIVNDWPDHETILPSTLIGPPGTEANPTPVVRLYWRFGHFEPVFDHAGPARQLLAEIERLLDGFSPDAVGDIREPARQVAEQALSLVDLIDPGTSPERVREMLQPLVDQLGIQRNQAADRASALSRASGQPPARPTRPDAPFGEAVSRPRRGPGDAPPSISTVRLGRRGDALRGLVRQYLDRTSRAATQNEVDLLTDVLGEAENSARGPLDQAQVEEWNQRISAGLRLLPAHLGPDSYAAELELPPGINPAELAQGNQITVPGLIRAHAREESVTEESVTPGDILYVIQSNQGRDLSGLVGPGPRSDLVMFDRGQHFEVVSNQYDGVRRRIVLRHPSEGDHEPDAAPVRSSATDPGQTTAPGQETTTADQTISATQQPVARPAAAAASAAEDELEPFRAPAQQYVDRHLGALQGIERENLESVVPDRPGPDPSQPPAAPPSPRGGDSNGHAGRPLASRGRGVQWHRNSWPGAVPDRRPGTPQPAGGSRPADQAGQRPASAPPALDLAAEVFRGYARNYLNYLRQHGFPLPGGMTQDEAVGGLAAVAEAASRPVRRPAEGWNPRVGAGLLLLPMTSHPQVYARVLPGAPDSLAENSVFTLHQPATAQADELRVESGGTVYVIASPLARDVSGLTRRSGLVMFADGTSFRVTSISHGADGTVINLVHDDAPVTDPAHPGPGTPSPGDSGPSAGPQQPLGSPPKSLASPPAPATGGAAAAVTPDVEPGGTEPGLTEEDLASSPEGEEGEAEPPDGRVLEPDDRMGGPGGWVAPVGMLADPPARHGFGAMGVELERGNVVLGLPPADWLQKAVLVSSLDGLVKITVDFGHAWWGADDVLYLTEEAMTRAGVAPHEDAEADDGRVEFALPEVVAGPWGLGAEPGRPSSRAVLDRIRDVEERWERAAEARVYDPDLVEGTTLAELFEDPEDPQYVVTGMFRDVQVARYPELSGDAPLFAQLSAGVPLGGGVLAALAELDRSITVRSPERAVPVHGAMRFGWQVAALFVRYVTGGPVDELLAEDVAALTLDRDVVSVAEVMALAFVQLSAVLRDLNSGQDFPKRLMALVARQGLRVIWAALDPQVQGFFAERAGDIQALFEAEFEARFPNFTDRYNRENGLQEGTPVDLWALEIASLGTTVGYLFDEILRPDPEGPRIRQEAFEVALADSGEGLDRSRGSGLPLVVLEMRGYDRAEYLPPGTRRRLDFQMATDLIGQLTGVAERGEAAAEFAHRLRASQEGRWLTDSLREVVLARGAQRVSAGGRLRGAVGSYLDGFPVQRPELEQALVPAAQLLSVSGLAQADRNETSTVTLVRKAL